MNIRNYKIVKERREALEKELKTKLPHVGNFSVDEKIASSRNCENMIGVTQIPLGIAGPLRIRHQLADISYQTKQTVIPAPLSVIPAQAGVLKNKIPDQVRDDKVVYKNYYLPLATTEGALVASVNRGCKAIYENGGASVVVKRVGATRGPVFKVKDLIEGKKLENYLITSWSKIKQTAENTSHHLTLLKYDLRVTGKLRFVRFYFDTQDAMGLNMVTIATDAIVKLIEYKINIKCLNVSGNFCIDKKPAWINFINERGFAVNAEITLSTDTLEKTLKTTAKQMYDSWLAKCMIGSAMSGSIGFNAQFANVVAAIFTATGQDLAHVVEGSMGMTTTEVIRHQLSDIRYQIKTHPNPLFVKEREFPPLLERGGQEGLYISVYLPSLMVGTVGGGTSLATQKEALQILGIAGGNEGKNSQKLAEIIGCAVLAGEISLLASLSEGTLAQSHERFARNSKF